MEFTLELEINVDRDSIIKHFSNIDNVQHWFDGFTSIEHISGNGCSVGSQYELKFKMSGMDIKVKENITLNNLPNEIHLFEDAGKVTNETKNIFEEINATTTKWTVQCSYSGGYKFIEMMSPGIFKNKTSKLMTSFKTFVENQ